MKVKMAMKQKKAVGVLAVFLTMDIAVADLTLYCENYADRNHVTFGGLPEYRECLLNCQCFIFELLCLERAAEDDLGYSLTS